METSLASVKKKIEQLMDAETEEHSQLLIVRKHRQMNILNEEQCFSCVIEHDITFENFNDNGMAFNQAEIFLLPEEYDAFVLELSSCPIPLPTHYRQWRQENPHIHSICLESVEPPEYFAERLAVVFDALEL